MELRRIQQKGKNLLMVRCVFDSFQFTIFPALQIIFVCQFPISTSVGFYILINFPNFPRKKNIAQFKYVFLRFLDAQKAEILAAAYKCAENYFLIDRLLLQRTECFEYSDFTALCKNGKSTIFQERFCQLIENPFN